MLLVVALAVLLFFVLDLRRHFSLAQLQSTHGELVRLYAERPWLVIAVYALLFITLFALGLPAGTVMTLAGGAIFGFWLGVLVVSFASTIGATLAFLGSRYLLGEPDRRRWDTRLTALNRGLDRDAAYLLFTLRLVPLIPPALLSVAFGPTKMPVFTFYWVSQLGMLSGTLIYVNAGTQLATLQSVHDILSPAVIASLLLLGLFPWLAKKLVDALRTRRADFR